MSRRRHIPLRTLLASALLTIKRVNDAGELVPVIPYEDAKKMTDADIRARFHFDHFPIAKALGGADVAHNLVPRPVAEHQSKTAATDIPAIAKTKRLARRVNEDAQRILLRPCGQKRKPTGKWRTGRKLRSRGFQQGARP